MIRVFYQLVCGRCRVVFPKQPVRLAHIPKSGIRGMAKGWTRQPAANSTKLEDLCPFCTCAKQKPIWARKAARK